MRIYLPATLEVLRVAAESGKDCYLPPGPALAVTPELREWYASGDTEELEYVAMTLAARASVGLLAGDPAAPRRRVVVAADVDDSAVRPGPASEGHERGRIEVTGPISFAQVAAFHVDGDEAVADVAAAAANPLDEWAGEEAASHELLWYATQEIDDLLGIA